MTTAYRRVLVPASQSPDGETPSVLSVEPGPDCWLVIFSDYDIRQIIVGAYRSRDDAITRAATARFGEMGIDRGVTVK